MVKAEHTHNPDRRGSAVLVGYGLDDDGGHYRITIGPDIRLEGGSAETHERMLKRARELREELTRRGLRLGRITRDQYEEVARIIAEISG